MNQTKGKTGGAVQTTGHAWDGDIQEFNNPLPSWWLWSFYATVVFAVVYWIFFPAWPVANSYTKGVMNNITFVDSEGNEKTMHWNTRALLIKDMQEGKMAVLSREYMDKVAAAGYSEILGDPEMMAFTRSMAKGIFGDNCAPCHGAGGAGVVGLFPNLADDSWLWGGSVENIETTITEGRFGFMPAFREALSEAQIDDTASYVLSLSGQTVDAAASARGKAIFQTNEGGCYYCHTPAATGLKSQGAANLTDQIWTIVDFSGAADLEAKKTLVKQVISNGVERRMPHWSERLTPAQIKLLTVYVHELGGGQ
ncbi:MAG: cytochrome-c oxidase, cbb3-type subunit III [Gammaproteobacteria bacterium]|nr:MAG: cytochrome-c oxidase, cbb3-type subunit III [Gammaproteobacteria bacterium]